MRGRSSCLHALVDDFLNHRADPLEGEELEQQNVLDPTVEDVSAPNAAAYRVNATRDLRDHASGDGAVGDQIVQLIGGCLPDEAVGVIDIAPQSLDIGEIHKLLRSERHGDLAGNGVGVDVVRLTV